VNDLADPNVLFVNQKLFLPTAAGPKSAGGPATRRRRVPTAPEGSELYEVKRGDCLSKIAVRHGMTVKELRDINELTTDMIRVGQKMIVSKRRADEGASTLEGLLDDPSATADEVVDPLAELQADPSNDPVTDFHLHDVQEGETLEKVADMYLVDQSRLKAVNNLASSKIQAGMSLKIPQSD
jgi:LysM repeat protein